MAEVKKEKLITYVGKLNHSKGYDIFCDAVIKILDESIGLIRLLIFK
mgnify:CR=1 FL=1